jgi:hypothetical protein
LVARLLFCQEIVDFLALPVQLDLLLPKLFGLPLEGLRAAAREQAHTQNQLAHSLQRRRNLTTRETFHSFPF